MTLFNRLSQAGSGLTKTSRRSCCGCISGPANIGSVKTEWRLKPCDEMSSLVITSTAFERGLRIWRCIGQFRNTIAYHSISISTYLHVTYIPIYSCRDDERVSRLSRVQPASRFCLTILVDWWLEHCHAWQLDLQLVAVAPSASRQAWQVKESWLQGSHAVVFLGSLDTFISTAPMWTEHWRIRVWTLGQVWHGSPWALIVLKSRGMMSWGKVQSDQSVQGRMFFQRCCCRWPFQCRVGQWEFPVLGALTSAALWRGWRRGAEGQNQSSNRRMRWSNCCMRSNLPGTWYPGLLSQFAHLNPCFVILMVRLLNLQKSWKTCTCRTRKHSQILQHGNATLVILHPFCALSFPTQRLSAMFVFVSLSSSEAWGVIQILDTKSAALSAALVAWWTSRSSHA